MAPPAGGKSLSILVAEDNKINALLACSLLSKLGHRPTVVSDGGEARRRLDIREREATRPTTSC